eukprot:TRINITY_DN3190_c2_g1_i1.p1 TRINITY_DN3190_c2_g1~~TRINITY_DN3190_c2_g1_i1.p1  ORF type:complete len:161 (+),score=33.41 TRINITY_DN3190_c2_g1_i1:3-485(+)
MLAVRGTQVRWSSSSGGMKLRTPAEYAPPAIDDPLRPNAPSLFSYRWPMNSLASGAHRATGAALVLGYSSVVLGGALVPSFRERVVATLGRVPRPLPYFFRWCVAFGITYHWAAGIRHLLWDYGFFGFNMQHVTRSSIGLYAGAFATAVAACTTKVTADK